MCFTMNQLAESLWSNDDSYVRITRNKEEQTVCKQSYMRVAVSQSYRLVSLVESIKGYEVKDMRRKGKPRSVN